MIPKISVIIPVYNTEKYLRKALNSILESSICKDIEIIVVDDYSNLDGEETCLEIVEYYQEKINIRCIRHTRNEGAFYARYTGLLNASGEYIAFLDPDDYIINDIYSKAYEHAKNINSDIVFFNMEQLDYNNQPITQKINYLYNFYKRSGESILNEIFILNLKRWVLYLFWNKLIKRDVIYNAMPLIEKYLKHITLSEDLLFNVIIFSTLYDKKSISCLEVTGYVYKRHSTSITMYHEDKFLKNIKDTKYVFSCIKDILKSLKLNQYINLLFQCELNRFTWLINKNKFLYFKKHPLSYTYINLNKYIQRESKLYNSNINFLINKTIKRILNSNTSNIWIFGSSDIAIQIYKKLKNKNILVKGFIVSNKNNKECFLELPIVNLKDLNFDFKDSVILSTISNEQNIKNILNNINPEINIFGLLN